MSASCPNRVLANKAQTVCQRRLWPITARASRAALREPGLRTHNWLIGLRPG